MLPAAIRLAAPVHYDLSEPSAEAATKKPLNTSAAFISLKL
jgi:hypothetical protein